MMRNKRKRFDISANTSYKRPRSSLEVNLSCVSNSTDSGNDSLNFDVNNITSSRIPLKNAYIVLKRIDADKENINKLVDFAIETSRIRTDHLRNRTSKNRLPIKIISAVDKIEYKNEEKNTSQNICITPKARCHNKNLKGTNCLGVLKQIQSYDLEEHLDICSKTVNLKSYTSRELTQLKNRMNNENDPSFKKTNNDKFNCSMLYRNRFSQSSISSISENSFTATPIGCSTMIDDNVSDKEDNEHLAHISIQEVSKRNCSFNRLNQVSQKVNNTLINQPEHDKEAIVIEADSVTTVRTSLNVNTSIDVINSKNSSKHKAKDYENRGVENKGKSRYLTAPNLIQESVNTVRTSLQVNTSYTSSQLQNSTNIDAIGVSATENIKMISINDSINTGKNNMNNQKVNSHKRQYQNEINSEKIDNSKCKKNKTDTSPSIIIESTNAAENNENMKGAMILPNTKRHKRKLLPLHEGSQLVSLTPVGNECSFPRPVIFKKQSRKKENNKYNKKKSGIMEEHSIIKKKKNHNENEKTQKKPRKVISKKITIKRIADEEILKKLIEERSNLGTANVCTSNGSSNDFQSQTILKKKQRQKLYIVTTGLSNEDKTLVKNVVRALGSAKIEPNITKNTTHVVTTGVRTMNLLHGIIRGCWLIDLEWVLKSLESKRWLSPENYEMAHFSKAVSENRKDRQLFGKSYTPELFTTCGLIYIGNTTKPPSDALKDLVKAAGGCITENLEIAKIIVGPGGLKETWILDCIMSGELQPYDRYQQA